MEKKEQRLFNRIKFSHKTPVKHFSGSEIAEIEDISLEGLCLYVHSSLDFYQQCTIDLSDFFGEPLLLRAIIVNRQPLLRQKRLRLGLKFLWYSEKQKKETQLQLSKLIQKIEKGL